MKIDYCFMGSTLDPFYLDFWPSVSKVWKTSFGITPVLGLVSNRDTDLYESEYGLIKEIKLSPNSNPATQSQIIRMYLSKYLNGNCIISDIDMIPLSKKYFITDFENYSDDDLIVLSSHHPQTNGTNQYPMCYVVSNSSVFNLIFQTNLNWGDFVSLVNKNNWYSDQTFLYECVQKYNKDKIKFPYRSFHNDRIDRIEWTYDENLVKEGFYIDSHLLRPYTSNKILIEKLISLI